MLRSRSLHRLLSWLVPAALLWGSSAQAQAKPKGRSHMHAQLALGPAYVTNFLREGDGAVNDHTALGLALQLDLGARLLHWLCLDVMQVLDVGMPERTGLTPLYRYGFGLAPTFRFRGAQLSVGVGAQLTWYMNYRDDPTTPMGADLGPLVSASLGYVFERDRGFSFGVHGVGRYYSSTDEYMGGRYDPYGYTLGLLASVGFLGRPFIGRSEAPRAVVPP